MDVLPLVLLLVMGVVISSTCGKYTSTESTSASVLGTSSSDRAEMAAQASIGQHSDAERTDTEPLEAQPVINAMSVQSNHQLVREQSFSSSLQSTESSNQLRLSSLLSANNPSNRQHQQHRDHHHQHLKHLQHSAGSISTTANNNAHQSDSSYSALPSSYSSYTYLRREMLTNSSVTCNDGTVAGYYIRRSYGSRRWIVFLEGGWYCFNEVTCHQRWLKMRSLMTSAHWPEAKTVGGILSSSPEENPFWWNANHVFIPYCSSDIWSGDSPSPSSGGLSFLGSRIVDQVITELLPKGLSDAKLLLLAGSSAGAAGVLINLDRIAQLLANSGSKADVRGLADSGWILDNQPFNSNKKPCIDAINCAPMDGIKTAFKMWSSRVPSACAAQYPTEPWRCIFGYRLYPTLKAPLFVFQWLYDEAQMHMDGVSLSHSQQQFKYIHSLGQQLRSTLENVTAVFAPSCVSHIVLTKPDWRSVSINKISLPEAIRCWESNTFETNRHNSAGNANYTIPVLNDSPNYYRKQEKKKKRRKHMRRRHKIKRDQLLGTDSNHNNKNKPNSHSQHRYIASNRFHHEKHRWLAHRDQCHHWLVDDCNWPQCNQECPKIHKNYMD